jgi:hypothetical protein
VDQLTILPSELTLLKSSSERHLTTNNFVKTTNAQRVVHGVGTGDGPLLSAERDDDDDIAARVHLRPVLSVDSSSAARWQTAALDALDVASAFNAIVASTTTSGMARPLLPIDRLERAVATHWQTARFVDVPATSSSAGSGDTMTTQAPAYAAPSPVLRAASQSPAVMVTTMAAASTNSTSASPRSLYRSVSPRASSSHAPASPRLHASVSPRVLSAHASTSPRAPLSASASPRASPASTPPESPGRAVVGGSPLIAVRGVRVMLFV